MLKIWNKENPKIIFIFTSLYWVQENVKKNQIRSMSADLAPVPSDNASSSPLYLFLHAN
jgi:hypothetical protein